VNFQLNTRTAWTRRASLRVLLVLGLVAAIVVGCSRPANRPLDGARPGSVASANNSVVVSSSPVSIGITPEPTISTAPTPALVVAASPTATGRGPIVSTIQPPGNGNVPAGPVTISARVSATSDITDVSLVVDGQATRPTSTGDVRNATYALTSNLAAGPHSVRIQVRDDQGRLGGYAWTFTAGASPPPAASPPARR
jgi:Bacterial Ig domain